MRATFGSVFLAFAAMLIFRTEASLADSFVHYQGRMKCNSKAKSCSLIVNPHTTLSEKTFRLKIPGMSSDFYLPKLNDLDLEVSGTLHSYNTIEVYGFKDVILNLAIGHDRVADTH